MKLPENHPKRFDLSNEVHARPPEPLTAPVRISCIALITDWGYQDSDRQVVCDLTRQYGVTPPGPGVKHFSVDLKDFRLIWERHTEFTRFTFIVEGVDEDDPFATPAIDSAPPGWVAALPGELIAATNAALIKPLPDETDHALISKRFFSNQMLIGSKVTGDAAIAQTDFRIHQDGASRILIQNRTMSQWHAGRIVQRLLEIETYRVMALLALPVAQALSPKLSAWERELSEITAAMTSMGELDEPGLLDRLTKIQAAVERGHTETLFRFGASDAYYSIVTKRIEELREDRMRGIQTFQEFIERRLGPAMATCRAVAQRQSALSERVDRATQLLSTRVDMSLERQNQEVLESMNRRAALQLRLQQTVEGLSIAAITYYVVGVIGYVAKGLEAAGMGLKSEIVTGVTAPFVLLLSGFGVWRARKMLEGPTSAVSKPEKDLD
jgi:uncharacterized membrane-anchored protein